MMVPNVFNVLHAFVRIILYPSHSNRACLVCDVSSLDSSLLAHILMSTHVDTTNDASDILDSLWASASIPASNPNAQDSDHDTSSTSSIYSMNIVNALSTIDLDLSSSNSDSDTDFSHFFKYNLPNTHCFHTGLSCHSVMYCHFYPTVQVSYMYVLCSLGLKQLNFEL